MEFCESVATAIDFQGDLSSQSWVRHIGLKLDKNPYLDIEYFKLRKFRPQALKLTEWYKTRWDKLQDGLCA